MADRIKKMKKRIILCQKFKDMNKKLKLFIKTNEIELTKKEKLYFDNCVNVIEKKIKQIETEILNAEETY
jgi:hypothetical protein